MTELEIFLLVLSICLFFLAIVLCVFANHYKTINNTLIIHNILLSKKIKRLENGEEETPFEEFDKVKEINNDK